jgi:hypothetical protein
MTDSDLSVLHAALAARRESCWDRLEDAVDELRELHGVAADQIVARISAAATVADAPQARDAGSLERV